MKIEEIDDKAVQRYGKITTMNGISDNFKVDTTCEKYSKVAGDTSKMFCLKNSWIKKTTKLSEQMDGKSLAEVLSTLRETFEEFREEAKDQIPSDASGVGNGVLRLLGNTREFIRSFELIETAITEEKIIFPLTEVNLGPQDDQITTKGSKDRESGLNNTVGIVKQASDVGGKVGKAVINRIQVFRRNDAPSKGPSFNDVRKIEEETISGHRDIYEKQRNYLLSKEPNYNDVKVIKEKTNVNHRVVHENQIESIIQSISNLLGIIDETFPSFLPKPTPKKEIPIDILEVLQGLLKVILQEDDTRLAREMRNQWDVINTLLGEYDISVVCFEDEEIEIAKDKKITKEEKIAWFEERSVNPNKFHETKTSSPALIGSDDVILRGVVFVPRNPSE